MLEVTCDKADDDSLEVLLLGYSQGDTSNIYYDTLYVKAVANKATYVQFSPSLTSSTLDFPTAGKLSIANEDSGANGAYPYFGCFADTNIWTMRMVMWHEDINIINTGTAATLTISDYQAKADTGTYDFTKTEGGAKQDTSTALTWPDTTARILTVSDSTVLRGQFALKVNYTDTTGMSNRINAKQDTSSALTWPDTTDKIITVSDTTILRAQIFGRADSAVTINWPDTTDRILTVSDSTVLRGQFALKVNYTDTTGMSNRILARADSAVTINWPDTTDRVLTVSDSTVLRGQFALKVNYTDTTGMSNRILARTDSAASINWPDTTDRVLTVSDSTVLRGQFALKVNYTDTTGMSNRILARTDSSVSINWPDTTDRVLTVSDSTVLRGQFATKAAYNKPINFSVINPKNSLDTCKVIEAWVAMTIDSIYAWSESDTCAFSLIETGRAGGSVSLIDAVDANTAGVGGYYKTETTISDASVAAGSMIKFLKSADSTNVIGVVIYWK